MSKKELQTLVAEQKILNKIYAIRGEKVMLDQDLAEMKCLREKKLGGRLEKRLYRNF